jgi:hypothetical protein
VEELEKVLYNKCVKFLNEGETTMVSKSDDALAKVNVDAEENREKQTDELKLMDRFKNFDYESYLADENRVIDMGEPTGRERW